MKTNTLTSTTTTTTYYIAEECLFVDGYTPKQYEEDYGSSRIYYTEWEK